ncbi:hypothetical protein [Paracoccus sp. R86501]
MTRAKTNNAVRGIAFTDAAIGHAGEAVFVCKTNGMGNDGKAQS